ncbi:glycoside hydrolase family 140 protein [Pontibacter sp. SGAir0037]|uniref:glycoside hydrolase family 140 protein n=1 Tax=Pontibacter sp. SGAir0037 TaxID=2571030 RepID=UPI001F0D600D|nr:glycoside hydrolase family 140 protein [Pontibacter sp. SGAir0037]
MAQAQAQHLKVSNNKRYLVHGNGKPFFYLGDTAWELFHRLNREEADFYLQNRKEKGFTVIQAVVLAELNGLRDPNPYGNLPLLNEDPAQPNEAYFEHVDYIVNKAEALGLYIGMLPTWGDKIYRNSWGVGPEIFNTANAKVFGEYIGRRYKNKPVIWILGGDRNPRGEQDVEIWRAMAAGIVAGVGGQDNALMSFHPQPQVKGGSSTWFHKDDWLDFNMFQTGHNRFINIYDKITGDYQLEPTKPTMDAEPIYEDHPIAFDARKNGYSEARDVRRAAYQSLFAGSHGHTYGCHGIWQMYAPGRQPVSVARTYWKDALDLPGATQMQYVRKLLESRPMLERVPDQSLVNAAYEGQELIQATRGHDYAFIYTTAGKPIEANLGRISGKTLKAAWYDPRTGKTTAIGKFKNTGTHTFTPPGSGPDNDWVLILDDARQRYKAP